MEANHIDLLGLSLMFGAQLVQGRPPPTANLAGFAAEVCSHPASAKDLEGRRDVIGERGLHLGGPEVCGPKAGFQLGGKGADEAEPKAKEAVGQAVAVPGRALVARDRAFAVDDPHLLEGPQILRQ